MVLKLSNAKIKPRSECTIKGTTSPNSLVYLLAVDQSVTLLGSDNDIDRTRVTNDLRAYNIQEHLQELKIKGNEGRYLDFGESNAFILTNALTGTSSCLHLRSKEEKNTKVVEDDSDRSGVTDSEDEEFNLDDEGVRKNFPETWIFEEVEADDRGKYEISADVPDTITSFVVSGFAIHPDIGLGVAIQQKVTVSLDFFLKLFLPYSIRFGEVLKVDVSVFNYISPKKSATVKVILFGNGEFEFVDTMSAGGFCNIQASADSQRTKTITVATGSGSSAHFFIRALITGEITLNVRATTAGYKDAVSKKLLVENEGLTVSGNKPFQIDLRKNTNTGLNFDLPIPEEELIQKSIVIEASAIGDMLGPALANIHNLM